MNPAIETLNHWGPQFLDLAGPILWQSTLLGLVILLLDFGLRRRTAPAGPRPSPGAASPEGESGLEFSKDQPLAEVAVPGTGTLRTLPSAATTDAGEVWPGTAPLHPPRWGERFQVPSSVRYALWLLLLVKLVLPPSLALPTSPVWWWSSTQVRTPAPVPRFQPPTVVITHDDLPMPEALPVRLPAVTPPPPPPTLTRAAWGLLAAGGVSLGLLGWLVLRWRQVVRTARAADSDPGFARLLAEACQRTKVRRRVRVKITRDTLSPAVCGLWRPVILLPQTLTETLSAEQLRAVLVHELIHIRRGDVWVNFVQALLQIIYWWHPLVWLANARIRRLREEAVDDAVVAALREEADIYAPTLLAVAKFALQRPLASLGLVGILESRSALRQRIERLVNCPPPRKAGLGFVSAFGLLVFSAVALPMGDAPPPAPASPAVTTAEDASAPATATPHVTNPYAQTGLVYTGPGRHDIVGKLEHLRLDNVFYDNLPLSGVLSNLSAQARMLDPKTTGINFLINPNPDLSNGPAAAERLDADAVLVTLHLSDVRLLDVLDAVVLVADHPIQYSIQDFGVVFSARPAGAVLSTRNFKVDGDTFFQGLEAVGSRSFGAGGASAGSGGGGNAGGTVVPVVNIAPEADQARPAQGGMAPDNTPAPQDISNRGPDETGRLVQEGKLLYEMGRLDESENKLNQALTVDPHNAAAQYYLNLIKQARTDGASMAPRSPSGEPIPTEQRLATFLVRDSGLVKFRRQTGLTADRPATDYLAGFYKLLADAGSRLPTNRLVWLEDQSLLLVHGTPAELGAVNLLVCGLNGVPTNHLHFPSSQARSVSLSNVPAGAPNPCYQRTFKVDTNTFFTRVQKAVGRSDPIEVPDLTGVLRELFGRFGVNLDPPKAVFYNYRLGMLFVKTSEKEDLDAIEVMIEALNQPSVAATDRQAGSLSHLAASNTPSAGATSDRDPNESSRLVQAGKLLYEMGKPDEARAKLQAAIKLDPDNATADYYLNLIQRDQLTKDSAAPNPHAPTNSVPAGSGRQAIVRKLNQIRLDSVSYDHRPLSEVLRNLTEQTRMLDPEKAGVDFLITTNAGLPAEPVAGTDAQAVDVGAVSIKLNLADALLADVLDALVLVADKPIKYSILESGIVFSAKSPETAKLFNRTFRVDPLLFFNGIELAASNHLAGHFRELGESSQNSHAGVGGGNSAAQELIKDDGRDKIRRVRSFFDSLGMNLEAPGKQMFYSDRLGMLYVRATEDDLDTIQRAVDTLNQTPPMIRIKTRFLEVTGDPGDIPTLTNHLEGQTMTGIMAAEPAQKWWRQIEAKPGSKILGEPEVTTLSGRQTQMRATQIRTLLAGINPHALTPPGISKFAATNAAGISNGAGLTGGTNREFGPVFDVVPYVLADGLTVNLTVVARDDEFAGYDQSAQSVTAYVDGQPQTRVSVPHPRINERQFVASLNLYDGQTLILSRPTDPRTGQPVENPGKNQKHLLVLATVSIVDTTGTRVHTDEDLPFARDQAPAQVPAAFLKPVSHQTTPTPDDHQ